MSVVGMMWEDSAEERGGAGADVSVDGWKGSARALAQLCRDLQAEVRHCSPGARLSARLRAALERLPPVVRRAVVSREDEEGAALVVGARRGCAEVAEYLVHVCGAPLEQTGAFAAPEEETHVHRVTPLWAAAVAGHLAVLRMLADAGADIDAPSDSGSTPARSACFMSHIDIVKFLVSRGADVRRANHNGSTCLINAVQSVDLVEFLLSRGAPVDAADVQLKTALHYAVQEHHADTVRVLLQHGADPYRVSRAGDDALQTACLKGAAHIVALLLAHGHYAPSRVADAYELLGATLLDEFNDLRAALEAWRRATTLRLSARPPLPKLPLRPPPALFRGAREWSTPEELDVLAADMDALRMQALLVYYRILGIDHRDTVFRIMFRGAAYADAHVLDRCVELWLWALEVRVARDTLVGADPCHTACALTRLLLEAAAGARGPAPPHEYAVAALEVLAGALPRAHDLVRVQPVCQWQAAQYDQAVRCATQLLHVALLGRRASLYYRAAACARALIKADVRSAYTRDTLLHLAVSRLNFIRSPYFSDENGIPIIVFPSVSVVRLLLRCGAAAEACNAGGATALHVAAVPYNFSTVLVEALLAAGAHLDRPNRYGDSAAQLVALNRRSAVRPLRHVTLQCLAARALLKPPAPPRGSWARLLPSQLQEFVELHRPPRPPPPPRPKAQGALTAAGGGAPHASAPPT